MQHHEDWHRAVQALVAAACAPGWSVKGKYAEVGMHGRACRAILCFCTIGSGARWPSHFAGVFHMYDKTLRIQCPVQAHPLALVHGFAAAL